jgi:hypothetical protein
MEQSIHVVYYMIGVGPEWSWQQIVTEQLSLLHEVGLKQIRAIHTGNGRDWFLTEAMRRKIDLVIFQTDFNDPVSGQFGIMEAERLAKEEKTHKPILYFYSLGTTIPHRLGIVKWRKFMEFHTVRRWSDNIAKLVDHDCVGLNWIDENGDPSWG